MNRKGYYIPSIVLFVATLGLYWTSRTYGLINLDDHQYLYGADGVLTNGFTLPAFIWSFESLDHAIWMPLTWMSYMLDFALFGDAPWWMHLHNALLHAANAVLVFVLLGMLGKKRSGIVVAMLAAVWAWHPLRVEPVAWISSRKDVLSLFFELLALIAWIKRLGYEDKSRQAVDFRWLSIWAFILACMAKPMAMTFPLLALLLEYLHTGKARRQDYFIPALIGIFTFYLAIIAQRVGGATHFLQWIPFQGRLLNCAAAFGIYCWKTIHPVDLAVACRNYWPELPRFWWQGLLICVGYGVVLLWTGWRTFFHKAKNLNLESRIIFCSLAFFLISVGPTLGLSSFGFHSYADRFTYLPAIGFSMMLAGLWDGISYSRWMGRLLFFCVISVLGLLLAFSHRQIKCWENNLSLFTGTLRVDGDKNYLALRIVGMHYYDNSHDLGKSLFYLDKAFKINRAGNRQYHGAYIMLLAEAGRLEEAKKELAEYQPIDSKDFRASQKGGAVEIIADLAKLLSHAEIALAEGNDALARQYAERVVELKPDDTWGNYLLGKMAIKEGDKEAAIRYWKQSMSDKRQVVGHRFLAVEVERLEKEKRKN